MVAGARAGDRCSGSQRRASASRSAALSVRVGFAALLAAPPPHLSSDGFEYPAVSNFWSCLPFCALFLLPLLDVRTPRRLFNRDLLVLLSLAVALGVDGALLGSARTDLAAGGVKGAQGGGGGRLDEAQPARARAAAGRRASAGRQPPAHGGAVRRRFPRRVGAYLPARREQRLLEIAGALHPRRRLRLSQLSPRLSPGVR
jgi:hypothetical protein